MADEKEKPAASVEAPEKLDPLRNVPRVAEPAEPEGEKTPDGRLILRDDYGRAYTVSTPQTGGLRTYLDEEEYPPIAPEHAPPAINLVPPQAAAGAASEFAPHPEEIADKQKPVIESAPEEHKAAAPAAGVPSFSSTQVTAAQEAAAPGLAGLSPKEVEGGQK